MFSFTPKPLSPNLSRRFCAPEGQRIYAIGDIHGRADLLKKLHGMILLDASVSRPLDNVVVYMGDYIDRGPFVRDTLDHVLHGPPDKFTIHRLRGNHEQIFLDFLHDTSVLPAWLELGGLWTLTSYGVYPGIGPLSRQRCEQLRNDLLAAMPDEHLSLLRLLSLQVQLGDYLFVHAGIDPKRPIERQTPDDLLWLRGGFKEVSGDLDFMVVHGHTIEEQPTVRFCHLGIDTGAYATGILTCAVFEEDRIRFLNTADLHR